MELSQRQRQILQYIVQHTETQGYPPTVREIGEGGEPEFELDRARASAQRWSRRG